MTDGCAVMTWLPFQEAVRQLQKKHPQVELHLLWEGPPEPILLDLIRTIPVHRGRGYAEAALRDVVRLAEERDVPLRLVVEPITGDDTDPERLIRWYRRHGFVMVTDGTMKTIMQRPSHRTPASPGRLQGGEKPDPADPA